MIPTISWVPKGASKSVPRFSDMDNEVENDNDEYMDVSMSKEDEEIAHALAVANTESDEEDDDVDLFDAGLGNLHYSSNEMDTDDDDSEDLEGITIKPIKPDDAVIVCASNEDDIGCLEVWILEGSEGNSNLYVHHDINISTHALCLAWLNCPIKGAEKGNFMAVGSMDPEIEIWDLDIMNEVEPSAVLGGIVYHKKKSNGKKNSIKYMDDSHTDSVLSLSWNKAYRNELASGSSDKLVKIWDVTTEKCSITMEHHSDKVQAVAWNDYSPKVLLSGSSDRSVVVKDVSMPSRTGLQWACAAGVESLAWDPHIEYLFVVGLENGMVAGFDTRASSSNQSSKLQPCFTLHAHDKAVLTVSYSCLIPNLLATGSKDEMVKLWDFSNNQPSFVASKNPEAGAVLSVSFSNDCPSLLAMGGSKGKNLELWDTLSNAAVSAKYEKYTKQNGQALLI